MSVLKALYVSDFFPRNRRTLNTLCLFYDRLLIHDYFGIFGCLLDKATYEHLQSDDEREIKFFWDMAGGLDEESKTYLKSAGRSGFDALVLKGVAQGLGCRTGKFSPTFVIKFAERYATFLRENRDLFFSDVLGLSQNLNNPHHPAHLLEGGARLDISCSDKQNTESLSKSILNNKMGCLFLQEHYKLPLVSDSEADMLRWDRQKDLLATALSLSAVSARVPTIADVPAADILAAREKLRDFLPPFRTAMLEAAWEIAKASRETSMSEVVKLAQLYYETRIEPTVNEIERKIALENSKLFRKLLERFIDKTALVAKSIDPTEKFSKWDLIASGLKSLLDIDSSRQTKTEIRGPYEFLVRLPKELRQMHE